MLPQLSTNVIASGVGQEAGAEKSLTRPVWVATRVAPAQTGPAPAGLTALGFARVTGLAEVAPDVEGSTTSVTFTVRTDEPEEKLTVPR
jgi:hypothetical protein